MIIILRKYKNIFNIKDRFLNIILMLNYKINDILKYYYILNFMYFYINNTFIIINSLKNKKYIKTILKNLTSNEKNIKLELNGVEYKIINKKKYSLFYLGYSHLILIKKNFYNIHVEDKLIKFYNNSNTDNKLKNIRFQLFKLKVLNKYKNKGFLIKND